MARRSLAALSLVVALSSVARADDSRPIPTSDDTVHYALGVRGRVFAITGWMLDPWLKEYTTATKGSLAVELTRRKGNLDIVTSVDFTWINPPDGNYLGGSGDPTLDTHYTQFRGVNLLSIDMIFLWHKELAPWVEFMVGGGVGLGLLLGDVYDINNSSTVCTKANAGDPTKCYPVSSATYTNSQGQVTTIGAIVPGQPDFQRKLDGTAAAQQQCLKDPNGDCKDTALHPFWHQVQEKPPVMFVVDFIIGLRFKLHRHLNVNVSGGFRDGWVFGGGPEYVF